VVGRDGAESLGEPTAATVESAESDDGASWLFGQTADAGTFSTDAEGVSTLTLIDVDPGVIAFTDGEDDSGLAGVTATPHTDPPSTFDVVTPKCRSDTTENATEPAVEDGVSTSTASAVAPRPA
jgi:hypothetical protein